MSDYDAIAKARSDALGLRSDADITNLPPGYIEGFEATLDTDLHVTLTAGSTSVEGRQVTTNESHQIVDTDFLGTRLGAYFYYIYIASTGEFRVDRAVPEYSDRYLYYAHPTFNWRALGKLWVDSADDDIKYVTNDVVGVSTTVTVAAFDDDEIVDADYKCTGTADQVLINAAIAFVDGAYDGGEVHPSRGEFTIDDSIVIKENLSLIGEGLGTVFTIDGDFHGIVVEGTSGDHIGNVTLANFKIQGIDSGSDAISIALIHGNYADNLTIRDVWADKSITYGILIQRGTDLFITGVRVTNFGYTGAYRTFVTNGIAITSTSGDTTLSDIVIDGGTGGMHTSGLRWAGDNCLASNILVKNISTDVNASAAACSFRPSPGIACISDINIYDVTKTLGGDRIVGLELFGPGIVASSVAVVNVDNTSSAANSMGIWLVSADYAIVASAYVSGCSGSGIEFSSSTDNAIVAGLTALSNGTDINDLGPNNSILSSNDDTYIQGGNFGVGLNDPDELVEFFKAAGIQLKLSGGAADYATFAVAADGALTITTVDDTAAEGDIILMPDGNVGIKNANPQELLHVGAGTDASDISATELLVTRAGPSSLSVRDSTNGVEVFVFASTVGGIIGTVTNDPLYIKTNNVDAIVIDTSQNVGLGVTDPGAGSDNVYGGKKLEIKGVTTSRGVLDLSTTNTVDSSLAGSIGFINHDNSDADANHRKVLVNIRGIVHTSDANAGDDSGGELQFLTKAEAGVLTEYVRLYSDGNFRIGDINTNYANFAPDGELTLAGTARVIRTTDIDISIPKRPTANPPAEGTEDGFPTLDFDDTQEESIYIEFHLPHDYAAAGTVHLHFDFFVDTAPVGAANAGWGVEYKKVSHGDNFTFAGASTVEAATVITTGTPGNDKKIHETGELSFTTAGWVVGDTLYSRLYRNVGVASDFTGDIRVIGEFHFEYLSDRLAEAT